MLFVSHHILQTISQHRHKNYIFVRLPFYAAEFCCVVTSRDSNNAPKLCHDGKENPHPLVLWRLSVAIRLLQGSFKIWPRIKEDGKGTRNITT